MDDARFDHLTRTLAQRTRRRSFVRGVSGLGAGLVMTAPWAAEVAETRRKGKGKALCRDNGSSCKKKGAACRSGNCLGAPFSIEAQWAGANTNYNTYFFVPRQAGNSGPSPFISSTSGSTINISCTPAASNCEDDVYPFACISQDAPGPGPEVTTVRKRLKGTYEFWFYLIYPSAAKAVTVTLRNGQGQDVRTWSSPANVTGGGYRGWHVCDIDGATGSVKSIDELIQTGLPIGAHSPYIDVCAGP
jgi:hypothetical protein